MKRSLHLPTTLSWSEECFVEDTAFFALDGNLSIFVVDRMGLCELCAAFLGQVGEVVEVAVEVFSVNWFLSGVGGRWRVAVEEFSLDVVFENTSRGTTLVRLSQTGGVETSGSGMCSENFLSGWDSRAAFFDGSHDDAHTVDGFQEMFGNSLRDERGGTGIFSELVDGQDTRAYQLRFGSCKVGKYKTRAIAENHPRGEMDGLEMLGLAWSGGDGDLFCAEESVDGGGFTNIGISYQTDLGFASGVGGFGRMF